MGWMNTAECRAAAAEHAQTQTDAGAAAVEEQTGTQPGAPAAGDDAHVARVAHAGHALLHASRACAGRPPRSADVPRDEPPSSVYSMIGGLQIIQPDLPIP